MSGWDVIAILLMMSLLLAPALLGFWARTPAARANVPWLVRAVYLYSLCHAVFCSLAIIGFIVEWNAGQHSSTEASIWILVLSATAAPAWYWWLFESYNHNKSDLPPLGVRLWASLSRRAITDSDDGLVNVDALAERVGKASSGIKAKAETYRAKANAYELELAKQHEDAQVELAQKAREYNDAKLRADEAKRRREKRG